MRVRHEDLPRYTATVAVEANCYTDDHAGRTANASAYVDPPMDNPTMVVYLEDAFALMYGRPWYGCMDN